MTHYTAPAALLLLSASLSACRGADPDISADQGTPSEPPPPVNYGPGPLVGGDYGYFPSTVGEADAASAYESFVANNVVSCGDNGLLVITDDPLETLSEGIGHGALLAVGWDDRETFDGLLNYYQRAAVWTDAKKGAEHGLMGWRIAGDPCQFKEVEPGAASSADLNMAMALLQAECRWGGSDYYYAAIAIMDAIRQHMTAQVAEGMVLLPSDMGDAPGCMNAAYSAPAFYRVFAKAQPEQAELWNRLADHAYVFLDLAANENTGLVGDWAPIGASTCAEATNFVGYDAIRTHWRAATDYVWFGSAAPERWLGKVTTWVASEVGSENLVNLQDGFFSDGSAMLGDPARANSGYLGAIAVGAIPVSQGSSDSFHDAFRNVPPANDASYYALPMRALYLMLSVNKFSPGCY